MKTIPHINPVTLPAIHRQTVAFLLVFTGLFLLPGMDVSGQSMIGQSMLGQEKAEVEKSVRKEHRDFRKDQSVVRQQFNYLKYVNGLRTCTWILYFTDEDVCKTSKLICDYSEFDEVVEKLSDHYRMVGDSRWEYILGSDTVGVTLTRQEWYFTVRESREN